MTGILNTLVGFVSTGKIIPTVIGQAYEGGFYAGLISTTANGIATHYLVVSPASSGDTGSIAYKNSGTASGASSAIDGPGNTAIMIAGGNSSVYPAAHFCNNAVIGGFTDWYMPAKNELEVCYRNLKPTTTSNNTFASGSNANAVPATGNYTSGNPAQTSAADFQTGGTQAFQATIYWGSTDGSPNRALNQNFSNGFQGNYGNDKINLYRVRCIRRVAV